MINASFLTHDEPHSPLKINVVLFVFLLIPAVLAMINFVWDCAASLIRNLLEILAVNSRSIKAPKGPFAMLVKKPQHKVIWVLVISQVDPLRLLTLDSDDVAEDKHIEAGLLLSVGLVVDHAATARRRRPILKLLIIILLFVILSEVCTVKVKQTVA